MLKSPLHAMQRAGKVLRKLTVGGDELSSDDIVRAAWPQAVGKQIARNSRVIGVRGRRIIVEVPDSLFQQNLASFERAILRNLAQIAGPGLVESIAVKIGVPRIEPGRAASPAGRDEATGIQDAVLRKIYRDSKKRLTS